MKRSMTAAFLALMDYGNGGRTKGRYNMTVFCVMRNSATVAKYPKTLWGENRDIVIKQTFVNNCFFNYIAYNANNTIQLVYLSDIEHPVKKLLPALS